MISYLHEFTFQNIAYKKAVSLGVTKDIKFILDKKNYKNSIVINKFTENYINEKIKINNIDIKKFYNNNLDKFTDGLAVKTTLISFTNKDDAYMAINTLMQRSCKEIEDSSKNSNFIKGIDKTIFEYKISYNNNKFPKDIMKTIFNIDNNKITMPFIQNNKFVILKKESEIGLRTKPLDEVYETVKQMLYDVKSDSVKKELIKQLKIKYKIKNNISEKYLKLINISK